MKCAAHGSLKIQDAKKSPKSRHLGTIPQFVGLCLRNEGMYRQSEKNLLSSNISSTCPRNMVNWITNGWDLLASLGHPNKFQPVSRLAWLRYCTDVAQRRSTKLCRTFGNLLGWYTIYAFLWLLSLTPDRILPAAKFTLRLSLPFSYIRSVTARHSSSGRQPNFVAL